MAFLNALHRLSIAAVVGGLLLIPGFLVLHVAGPWAALAAWTVTYLAIAWTSVRSLRREGTTLWEALTAGRPDVDDKPLIVLLLAGLVFAVAGVAVWLTDTQHPTKGEPPTLLEQAVFGTVFFAAGSGLFGFGLSAALIRQVLRSELAEVDRRIAMRPDCADFHFERATLLMARDRKDEAIESLGRVIELAPDKAEAFRRRGEIHWYEDRYDEALADLTRAIELEPNDAEAYTLRALVYEDIDQPERADDDAARAQELETPYDSGPDADA